MTAAMLRSLRQAKDAFHISMGECNTILRAYTLYRHLRQRCTHPSICRFRFRFSIMRNLINLSVPTTILYYIYNLTMFL